MHCGIFFWCIVGFVRWVYWYSATVIPWICYERSFSEFYLSIWNQLVFNQRLQLFVQSPQPYLLIFALTHWGRVTHICVSKLTIIGPDNVLSPGRRQAIIWTNAVILLIRTLGTNFSEILGEIHSFSFSKMHLKMSSAKWRLFGPGLNELRNKMCFPNILLKTKNKWISEFHKTNRKELKCWSSFYFNYFLRYYLMMQHQPIVKTVYGANEWACSPYQLLSAPYLCCFDRCPFVPRHS